MLDGASEGKRRELKMVWKKCELYNKKNQASKDKALLTSSMKIYVFGGTENK